MTNSNRVPSIVVTNLKGGVAKTTTAFNLAGALARQGKSVLAIDLDPQGNLSQSFEYQSGGSTTDIFLGNTPEPCETSVPRVTLVPADKSLSGLQAQLATDFDLQFRVRDFLAGLSGYDFFVIDTPPTLGSYSLAGALAATHALIPQSSQFFSIKGTSDVLDSLLKIKQRLNPGLVLLGVCITAHDRRTALGSEVIEKSKARLNGSVFNTVIHRTIKIEESQVARRPVVEMFPGSEVAKEYERLTAEILGKIKQGDAE
ncbi:MAG: ParA family protein [Spirochaetia bacterium]|nr:ParA family protein [Spirochaetia bacterium]